MGHPRIRSSGNIGRIEGKLRTDGATQNVGSMSSNTWNESCHTLSYKNTASVASGTYTGRATYTMSAP